MSKSSASINEKNSLSLQQRDEGESDLEQTDDITDDSTSSYYTALCSLWSFGDQTHTLSTERPAEGGTFEFLDCATTMEGITSKSLTTDTTLSQDYKTQEEKGTEVLPDVSQCEQDKSSSTEGVRMWIKTSVVGYNSNKCGYAVCKGSL